MTTLLLVKWIHILCVVGLFGGLVLVQFGLPAAVRNEPTNARQITRLLSLLLALGLLAGAGAYGIKHGHELGGHYNGVIGFKFAMLLVVGGLLPMSRKEGRGDFVRGLALILLGLAALAAGTL